MANKSITVVEPSATSNGLRIEIQKDAQNGRTITVTHVDSSGIVSSAPPLKASDFSGADQTTIGNAVTAILAAAKAAMGF